VPSGERFSDLALPLGKRDDPRGEVDPKTRYSRWSAAAILDRELSPTVISVALVEAFDVDLLPTLAPRR
jgi:hypothetical protein